MAASNKADATGVEVPAVEDDVYTEVQSDVHQREEIPPIKEGRATLLSQFSSHYFSC